MQNHPHNFTALPLIMNSGKNIGYNVTFGNPSAKGITTIHPSIVTPANVSGTMSEFTLCHQAIENAFKQYTPYTNSDESWRILNIMIGSHNMSGWEVSNQGRIRRLQDKAISILHLCNKTGQVVCNLGVPSSPNIHVDALVCQIFCMHTLKTEDKKNADIVVHHRDGNRLNNHADNLEFMLKDTHIKTMQDSRPHDHTVVLDGRLYHHFGARLSYQVTREPFQRF